MSPIKELSSPTVPPSLWATTAAPMERYGSLEGDITTEVAVVGGGFTGLSTALHLSERGVDTTVLDAAEPGWGASGRNGGQVIPGLKHDPDELEAMYGPERRACLVEAASSAADVVFDLVERYQIDCAAQRNGWIQAAFSARSLATVMRRAAQWERRGVSVRRLDKKEAARLIGGGDYVGGWVDPRGGSVQPLSYARGLAHAACTNGVRIFAHSRAIRLERQGERWRITTPEGAVIASTVVLATNGYTETLWLGLQRSIIPVYSFQLATRPLSLNVRRTILPEGHVVSDTRRLLRYFRLDPHGRLLMGGRSPFTDRPTVTDARPLKAWIEHMFPQIGDVELEFVWSGRVALTTDHLPHLHALAPRLYAGLGYNGRGVAMATQMGRFLAGLATGTPAEEIPFPVTDLRPIRFHGLHRPALKALVPYYRLRDAMEARHPG